MSDHDLNILYQIMVRICCIDGVIGVGKTTILTELARRGYTVVEENVDDWLPYLDLFQRDKRRWAFTLQMKCLQSLSYMIDAMRTRYCNSNAIIFVERDIMSVAIFTNTAFSLNLITIEEYNLFCMYYNRLISEYAKPEWRILLDVPVDECVNRIYNRDRLSERESIDDEYIDELMRQYATISTDLTVNGLQNPSTIVDVILSHVDASGLN
jgi:deoxyadenosine/deoxycytidine kinase